MLARLGYMIHVLSWIAGAPFLVLMVYGWATATMGPAHQIAIGAVGIAILCVGRATQYVLSGQ